jgi:hypothetical protein
MAQATDSATTSNVVFLSTASRPAPIKPVFTPPLETAHHTMITGLSDLCPHYIRGDADHMDVQERADHCRNVLKVVAAYIEEIVVDTGDRMPFGVIFSAGIKNILNDAIADIHGGIQHGAITMEMTAGDDE